MKNSNRRIRDSLIRAIGSVGLHIADRTPTADVRAIIRSLRPIGGESDLTRPYEGDLLLQMDIEGGEYDTLMNAPTSLLAQFRIMVVEFHYLHELFNQRHFDFASRLFRKISQTHSVVHIHPNNCCGSVRADGLEIPRIAEFTFHRNDRIKEKAYRRTFPHPLDRNNTRKATLALPPCWYE
jgi:hypothetical protein